MEWVVIGLFILIATIIVILVWFDSVFDYIWDRWRISSGKESKSPKILAKKRIGVVKLPEEVVRLLELRPEVTLTIEFRGQAVMAIMAEREDIKNPKGGVTITIWDFFFKDEDYPYIGPYIKRIVPPKKPPCVGIFFSASAPDQELELEGRRSPEILVLPLFDEKGTLLYHGMFAFSSQFQATLENDLQLMLLFLVGALKADKRFLQEKEDSPLELSMEPRAWKGRR